MPYTVHRYERDPKTMLAPPELRALHPLGKSPVISDEGQVVAESGAIIEYVLERHGGGRLLPPAGSPEHLRFRYWLHYAEGSAMPPLLLKLVFGRLPKPPMPALIRPVAGIIAGAVEKRFIDPQLKLHLDFLEGELGKSAWFAGPEFTAADIQMSFPLEAFASRGGLDESRPKLMAFLSRIHERPAYQRALETGGPYDLVR